MSSSQASTSHPLSTPARGLRTVTTTTTAFSPNGELKVQTKTTTTSLFKVDARYPTPVSISSDDSDGEDEHPPLASPPLSPSPSRTRPSPRSSLVSSISSLSLTPPAELSSRAATPPAPEIPPPSAFKALPAARRYYVVTAGIKCGIFTNW
ncbi:hypothetical protein V5O48_009066 [Marasmius crinis-equi]|uniref:Uncharacterized protein n=1 Tax=Marasmius crinis-equi TaxID=585013 RepID=A0ABR3FCA5_9AGAR